MRYNASVRKRVNFYIDEDLAEGLSTVKARDGVSESEQIRRGIRLYLESKGITGAVKATRKKGGRKKK